jgi:gliding motility-associated-like protein
MTIHRLLFFICLPLFLTPVLSGQQQDLQDSLTLTSDQLKLIQSMAADTSVSELAVPNVFTPNGDQLNDYFEVPTDGTKVYELTIFTRTGTRIYHSRSPRIYWDGRSLEGKELPEGVYYYVIEEVDSSPGEGKAGFMHLFR